MDSWGRYQPIPPDREGRLLSEQTGLWFTVSPKGDRIVLADATSGEVLMSRQEQEAALEAAKERADREAEARKAAEAEVARLREQLERLQKPGS